MSGIFISYRRDDSGPWAGRINDALVSRFGAEQVFLDVDGIRPGEDYRRAIARTIEASDVVLVVIGPDWATLADEGGQPRIAVDNDVHRAEVTSALSSDLIVIPVLVGDAEAPAADDLPAGLEDLSYRNAAVITDRSFGRDIGALMDSLESTVKPAVQTTPGRKPPVALIGGVLAAVAAAVVAVLVLGGKGDDPEAAPATTTVPTTSAPAATDANTDTDTATDTDAGAAATDGTDDGAAASPAQLPDGQTEPDQLPFGQTFTISTTIDGERQCLESNNTVLSTVYDGASYVTGCADDDGQMWQLGMDEFGYYYLQSGYGGPTLCFDADVDDYEEWGGAAMTSCEPEAGAGGLTRYHRYVIEDAGDGEYFIVSLEYQEDGYCLEAIDPDQDDFGGGTFLTDCSGAPNQLWTFAAAS